MANLKDTIINGTLQITGSGTINNGKSIATTDIATTSLNGLMSSTDKTKLDNIINLIYPVGSIYMSVNSTNPSTLFGGEWVPWGAGRVPVGMGTGSDGTTSKTFSTVEGTGGEYNHKLTIPEMPSHTHTATTKYDSKMLASGTARNYIQSSGTLSVTTFTTISNTGGDGSHNNMPPYVTCYMWKRTA